MQNSGLKGSKGKHTGEIGTKEMGTQENRNPGPRKGGSEIMGYVPLQIINLSLEEVELSKHMYVGTASPTEPCVGSELAEVQDVRRIEKMEATKAGRGEIVLGPCDQRKQTKKWG